MITLEGVFLYQKIDKKQFAYSNAYSNAYSKSIKKHTDTHIHNVLKNGLKCKKTHISTPIMHIYLHENTVHSADN